MQIAEPLQIAIDELSKLPSIGKKSALRLALFLLKSQPDEVDNLVKAILDLKRKIKFCKICGNISVEDECEICSNPKRDRKIICVVEEASDIIAIEKTNEYNGLYHVLGGVLDPLKGVGIESLNFASLLTRIENEEVKEILLALNPDAEGEATSIYLARQLKARGVKVSRIARGLPIGGDLEFADEATIGRALINRTEL